MEENVWTEEHIKRMLEFEIEDYGNICSSQDAKKPFKEIIFPETRLKYFKATLELINAKNNRIAELEGENAELKQKLAKSERLCEIHKERGDDLYKELMDSIEQLDSRGGTK